MYLEIFLCYAGACQIFMSAVLFLIMDVLEWDDDATEYENFDSEPGPKILYYFLFFLS